MRPVISLPGLELLIQTLQHSGIGVQLDPAVPGMPGAGHPVLEEPFDPYLATLYARCNGGRLGHLRLFQGVGDRGLMTRNLEIRSEADSRHRQVLRFATLDSTAYSLGTVPSLAASDGPQPVVMASDYIDFDVFPLASTVDRAFRLYALYCETCLRKYGGKLDWNPAGEADNVSFPFHFVREVAQDRELVRLLEDGRFEALTAPAPDSRDWVNQILAAARASS